MNDYVDQAPCIFCDYSGAGFFQEGTHKEECPWHKIGGLEKRSFAFGGVVTDLFHRLQKMKTRTQDLSHEIEQKSGDPISSMTPEYVVKKLNQICNIAKENLNV